MRRLSVITVEHESAGSSSGSVSDAWRSECGRDEDTWEVFQAHKGVIPTLSQVQSSAAVLVLGSAGAAATLRDEYRRALLELLLKMAALQLLPIFAAGSGAQASPLTATAPLSCSTAPSLICDYILANL